MDLSLDEIIKKNNPKLGPLKSKGRQQSGRRNITTGRVNKPVHQNNGRVNKPLRRPLQKTEKSRVVDARMKIIQKNRQRMTDARDKLAQLAKQSDARNKIKGRIRQLNAKPDGWRDRGRVDRDNLVRNSRPAPLLQRSFSNNTTDVRVDPRSLIRCTINRPAGVDHVFRPSPVFADNLDMPLSVRPHSDFGDIKVVTQNEYTHAREYTPEPMLVDHYDSPYRYSRHLDSLRGGPVMSRSSGVGRMSQEMRARLDSPKPPPTYSYSSPPPSPPPSPGHRIVVSNLHTSVTHEDIKELFEDIGPLLTSRLVRPGTAEVVYKLQKDAKKAVDAYHNRQLDAQPMKCLLVNPRSPPSSGVLRSNNVPVSPKYPSSSKSMVVPDLSAIHKALFTSK